MLVPRCLSLQYMQCPAQRAPSVAAARGYAHTLNPEFLVEKEGVRARVLDGKKLANTINKEIKEQIKEMVAAGKR